MKFALIYFFFKLPATPCSASQPLLHRFHMVICLNQKKKKGGGGKCYILGDQRRLGTVLGASSVAKVGTALSDQRLRLATGSQGPGNDRGHWFCGTLAGEGHQELCVGQVIFLLFKTTP